MQLAELRQNGRIIFETITGSHAYGLNTPTSDTDYRGIFYNTSRELLSLQPHQDEVGDDKQDIKFYSLRKFFELAKDCNPNICELLFMPENCIVTCTPVMQEIIRNRNLFISTKAKHTFSGYAFAQIKKAKGQNKWVNNDIGKGLVKLRKLLADGKVNAEWIKSRFPSYVSDAVLGGVQ